MWKLLTCKFILICIAAYLVMTRQYFWDISYYLGNIDFRRMYVLAVIMLFVYLLLLSLMYNVFLVFLPKPISRWSPLSRRTVFFVLTIFGIIWLHLEQMDILFRMKGTDVFASNYIYKDIYYFAALWIFGVVFMYRFPHFNVFNHLIESLFKGVLRIAMANSGGGGATENVGEAYGSITLPMSEGESRTSVDELRGLSGRRIKVYNILLLSFSKNNASYLVDTSGNRIYIEGTSTVIDSWTVAPWFVKISRNIYLNMWYFSPGQHHTTGVLMDEWVLKKVHDPIKDWGGELTELLTVTERCSKNLKQHFEYRDQLGSLGWGEYFYY